MNTETVTTEDNAILLNSNATSTPTEDGGVELERGNLNNARVFWNEATDRWQHGIVGTMYNIPLPSEADITRFYIRDDSNSVATITKDEVLAIDGGTAITTDFVSVNSGENDRLEISHGAVSHSNSSNSATLTYSGNFSAITGLTVNTQGHVTLINTTQFTMPAAYVLPTATTSILGGIKLEDDTAVTTAAQTVSTTADRYYGIQLNNNDQAVVNVPWENTFRTVQVQDGGSSSTTIHQLGDTEVLQLRAGTNVTLEPDTPNAGNVTINAAGYTLPVMTSTVLGGAKVFSDTAGGTANAVTSTASRTYGLQLNSSNQLVVNVPWSDTNTDTNTNQLTTFVVRDSEPTAGTPITISHNKEWKFVEGERNITNSGSNDEYIDIRWTDTSSGTSSDPYDLMFSHKRTSRSNTGTGSATTTFGGNFTMVDSVTTNATGHVTAVNTKTITMPANPNTDNFLNDVSTIDNGSDMILRHTMNSGTAHDVGITASGIITLTPGAETFEIGAPGTNVTVTQTSGTDTISINSSTGNDGVLLVATTLYAGAMSKGDKAKLDGIDASADVNQNAYGQFKTFNSGTSAQTHNAANTGDDFSLNFKNGIQTSEYGSGISGSIVELATDQRRSSYSGDIYLGHAHATAKSYIKLHSAVASGDTGYIDFYTSYATSSSPTHEFRMANNGDFHADGDVIAYSTTTASDAKLKDNIQKVEGALELVSQLDGVTFNWKKDGRASAGVIAQNIEKVIPSAVKEVETLGTDDTHKAVDYNQLSALFIEAIKELKEENKLLRAEIESLKDINS